jgi:deoxyribodipyrimidine photolyase-related protein
MVAEGLLEFVPHEGWLSTDDDFAHASTNGAAPWRMDAFYRHLRQRTGILMERGKPVGGKYSHDVDNRLAWRGDPPAPAPPRFVVDDVTAEVVDLVRTQFGDHPGTLDPTALPATVDDAQRLWDWAKEACLPLFGPYEDALSTRSRGLFHTRISGLVNLHRLLPKQILDDATALDLPLSSQEGFVRQVLGWREFVRHVHVHTDGFRRGPGSNVDGKPNVLSAHTPLPAAFWPGNKRSGLRCLDLVVEDVWAEGYSHHISRLMVLSNIATLLDVEPRALNDWFHVAYTDAYDWVVEPNVLGMGTFAVGDVMTTKPYTAGAAYIDKMSDFCSGCAFKPKKAPVDGGCPLTALYWAHLRRHADVLDDVDRLKLPMASCRKRSDEQHAEDARIFAVCTKALGAGETLVPTSFQGRG